MVAATAGVVLFVTVHALWILPIWFILVPGLSMALAGGLALGWAYHEIEARLPPAPLRIPLLIGALLATLLPGQIFAIAFAPVPPPSVTSVTADLALRGLMVLLVPAIATGALIAVGLRAPRRGIAAFTVGAAAYALSLGHNVPLIFVPSAILKMWGIITLVTAVVVVLLVVRNPLRAKEAATG